MSDWLSELEERRKWYKTAEKAKVEEERKRLAEYHNRIRSSYEQNMNRCEQIYESIGTYAKKAAEMGFDVRTERQGGGCMFIVGRFTYWGEGGEWHSEATLELRPWDNGFRIHYNGRVSPTTQTYRSLYRVTDRVIQDWVKWAAGEGPGNPVEDAWFKIIFWSVGVGVGLLILGALLASTIVAIVSRPNY